MLTPVFGLGADLGYHWWGGNEDVFAGADATFSGIQATAQGTFMIPMQGKARPYLAGGLGLYNMKFELESSLGDQEDSSSEFGYNLGGGLNWLVSPMYMIGIGAGYHSVQTEGEATNFYTVGVNLLWGKSGGQ
jgi:opacity protein-like surface antigen